mgnify:CR=1 FL=1
MEHRKPGVAIVGTGALGANLAQRLHACGYRIEALFNRTPAHARTLAEAVGAPPDAIGPAAARRSA